MAETAKKPATYADIEALQPHLVGEILFGRLNTHLRQACRHSQAKSALGAVVCGPFQIGAGGPRRRGPIEEPELILGPLAAAPELAGWYRERRQEPRAHDPGIYWRRDQDRLPTDTFFQDEQVHAAPSAEIEFSLGPLWPIDLPSATTKPSSP